MTEIAWDDGLSVGINLIDEQHKMLIQHLYTLSKAVHDKHGATELIKTLDFLIDYTDFHFSTEEKNMAEQQYDGLTIHRAQHEEFKTSLNNLVQDFEEEGATESLSNYINDFLFNWLVVHIKGIDVEFGKFLKIKGVDPTE
jgi:hemerythrin